MTSYITVKTKALGNLLLVANDKQLTGIYFLDSKHPSATKDWKLDPKHPVLKQAKTEIEEYFQGKRTKFSFPLHYAGTDFQRRVWQQIARIPFGKTITYSQLAKLAGKPNAVRAAGTATGKNPLGIVIPCHRVIAKNGGIGGYAGGLDRKRHLLKLEKDHPRAGWAQAAEKIAQAGTDALVWPAFANADDETLEWRINKNRRGK